MTPTRSNAARAFKKMASSARLDTGDGIRAWSRLTRSAFEDLGLSVDDYPSGPAIECQAS